MYQAQMEHDGITYIVDVSRNGEIVEISQWVGRTEIENVIISDYVYRKLEEMAHELGHLQAEMEGRISVCQETGAIEYDN